MPLIAGTFEQAENAAATSAEEEREAIEELLSVHTHSESSLTSGLEPLMRGRPKRPE
jgi:hypothetical protein